MANPVTNPPKFNRPNPAGGSNDPNTSVGPTSPTDWSEMYRWFTRVSGALNVSQSDISSLSDTSTSQSTLIASLTNSVTSLTMGLQQAAIAYASSSVTLTGSFTNIPGATLTLSTGGIWLITGTASFLVSGAGDLANVMRMQLVADGNAQTAQGYIEAAAQPVRMNATQQWLLTLRASAVLQLQGMKDGGTGTSVISSGNSATSISAVWLGT